MAQKIDRLFRTALRDDGGEFTYRQVEAGVRALTRQRKEPDTLSASYLCELRKGNRTNPTLKQVELIAEFFDVPVTYFVGTPDRVETIDADLSLVRALRDRKVRDIALQVASLTPAGVHVVAELITSLQAVPGMTRPRRRRKTSAAAEAGDHETSRSQPPP